MESRPLLEFLEARRFIEENRENVGTWLRSSRLDARLSQTRFAEMSGVSQAYVSMVESGSKTPGAESLGKMINALSEGSTNAGDQEEDTAS
jgi:transcriptional regulator with XRE-family HTH domain